MDGRSTDGMRAAAQRHQVEGQRTDEVDMKRPGAMLLACLLACPLAGCGSSDSDTPDAALPVVAPMHARERLLHDVADQNALARERRDTIESIPGSSRDSDR